MTRRDFDIPDTPKTPTYLPLIGTGWLAVAALAAGEIVQSHSPALFYQLLAGFAAFAAYRTFARLRAPETTPEKPVFHAPYAPLVALFSCWAVGGVMSQAIYGTVWSHDYYALTTLRMLGGRLRPDAQKSDELRGLFLQCIHHGKPFTADRLLQAGLNPDIQSTEDPGADSLLAEAVRHNQPGIVRSLLDHGASVDPGFGKLPSLVARETKNGEMARLIDSHRR